eukprot:TRINITY_DN90275_c0_g1_i1.p1 TRINITY_DN90275_c0_g1~~TRINITY_DN90275_c0_g1_i1.p1  ORF type:complete len:191 (+),score=2.12 TRINITY_DN90275_c0_g1_i1:79-651(+)
MEKNESTEKITPSHTCAMILLIAITVIALSGIVWTVLSVALVSSCYDACGILVLFGILPGVALVGSSLGCCVLPWGIWYYRKLCKVASLRDILTVAITTLLGLLGMLILATMCTINADGTPVGSILRPVAGFCWAVALLLASVLCTQFYNLKQKLQRGETVLVEAQTPHQKLVDNTELEVCPPTPVQATV